LDVKTCVRAEQRPAGMEAEEGRGEECARVERGLELSDYLLTVMKRGGVAIRTEQDVFFFLKFACTLQ
jgi:hypothetical protein